MIGSFRGGLSSEVDTFSTILVVQPACLLKVHAEKSKVAASYLCINPSDCPIALYSSIQVKVYDRNSTWFSLFVGNMKTKRCERPSDKIQKKNCVFNNLVATVPLWHINFLVFTCGCQCHLFLHRGDNSKSTCRYSHNTDHYYVVKLG